MAYRVIRITRKMPPDFTTFASATNPDNGLGSGKLIGLCVGAQCDLSVSAVSNGSVISIQWIRTTKRS